MHKNHCIKLETAAAKPLRAPKIVENKIIASTMISIMNPVPVSIPISNLQSFLHSCCFFSYIYYRKRLKKAIRGSRSWRETTENTAWK